MDNSEETEEPPEAAPALNGGGGVEHDDGSKPCSGAHVIDCHGDGQRVQAVRRGDRDAGGLPQARVRAQPPGQQLLHSLLLLCSDPAVASARHICVRGAADGVQRAVVYHADAQHAPGGAVRPQVARRPGDGGGRVEQQRHRHVLHGARDDVHRAAGCRAGIPAAGDGTRGVLLDLLGRVAARQPHPARRLVVRHVALAGECEASVHPAGHRALFPGDRLHGDQPAAGGHVLFLGGRVLPHHLIRVDVSATARPTGADDVAHAVHGVGPAVVGVVVLVFAAQFAARARRAEGKVFPAVIAGILLLGAVSAAADVPSARRGVAARTRAPQHGLLGDRFSHSGIGARERTVVALHRPDGGDVGDHDHPHRAQHVDIGGDECGDGGHVHLAAQTRHGRLLAGDPTADRECSVERNVFQESTFGRERLCAGRTHPMGISRSAHIPAIRFWRIFCALLCDTLIHHAVRPARAPVCARRRRRAAASAALANRSPRRPHHRRHRHCPSPLARWSSAPAPPDIRPPAACSKSCSA
eukprot:ctg_282.g108